MKNSSITGITALFKRFLSEANRSLVRPGRCNLRRKDELVFRAIAEITSRRLSYFERRTLTPPAPSLAGLENDYAGFFLRSGLLEARAVAWSASDDVGTSDLSPYDVRC